ncbi:hypothetical protein DFS34DRAFT_619947 [Phlyctochytrium arcticum]|nr:hypothetical protein DFS34DRAFT_619947 [Phlyctochytrium arcticum]
MYAGYAGSVPDVAVPQQLGTLQICDQAASISLLGSSVQGDLLPLSTEEPFLLETLGTLIRNHKRQSKTLILARVQAVDGKFFYYSAHQLNKVIFRKYGKNSEYLFRLYAMNPLTNTEIVGDVRYFAVEVPDDAEVAPEVRDSRAKRFLSMAGSRPSSAGTARSSSTDMRRSSMSALMRNSLGIRRDSIKVAEISGPAAPDIQGLAASSISNLKVEVSHASRGDLAIMEALDKMQEEREQKGTQDVLAKKLREQMKDRRAKIQQKESTESDLQHFRPASLDTAANGVLDGEETQRTDIPDLTRMVSTIGDLPFSAYDLDIGSDVPQLAVSSHNLHTTLSITSLALVPHSNSTADAEPSSSTLQLHTKEPSESRAPRPTRERRAFGSGQLNPLVINSRSSATSRNSLHSPHSPLSATSRTDLRSSATSMVRSSAHLNSPDSPTVKVTLRPKTADSRTSNDRLDEGSSSPYLVARRKSSVAISSEALTRPSVARRVEFASSTIKSTASNDEDDDIEALKSSLKDKKAISHDSIASQDREHSSGGWRRKLSLSVGNGLDNVNRLRSKSISSVNRSSESLGKLRRKSQRSIATPSTQDLREQYRAVFIGTDDDFLQRACVRKLFTLNALDASDALLFDMPPEVLKSEGIGIEAEADCPAGDEVNDPTAYYDDPYSEEYVGHERSGDTHSTLRLRQALLCASSMALALTATPKSSKIYVRHRAKLLVVYFLAVVFSIRFSEVSGTYLYIASALAATVFLALAIFLYVLPKEKVGKDSDVDLSASYADMV